MAISVESGIYRLRNAKSKTYLDASTKRRGVIQGWDNRPDDNNQKWIVEERGEGFTFQNMATGQYASVAGMKSGTEVKGSSFPTEWNLKDDDGFYVVYVAGTKVAIDLDMGKDENGADINILEYAGSLHQKWKLERVGQDPMASADGGGSDIAYSGPLPVGAYAITNVFTSTALDLSGASAREGARIIGFRVHNGNNQTWILELGLTGYRLKNAATGTYLSFGRHEFPTEALLLTGTSNPVEWDIRQATKGYQICLAANSRLVVDLAGGDPSNGATICLWADNSGENQKWYFREVRA